MSTKYSLKQFTLNQLLAYIEDCHGVTKYDLEERDTNTKSKTDVMDSIASYGWTRECFEYCQA